jgi:osmotically-inducible protein OsmY
MYAANDEKIRQEIQLELNWMPLVQAGCVGVAVQDGVATLTGHVPDASARQAAEQLARRVPGVRSVANEIHVRRTSDVAEHEANLIHAVVDAFGRGHRSLN